MAKPKGMIQPNGGGVAAGGRSFSANRKGFKRPGMRGGRGPGGQIPRSIRPNRIKPSQVGGRGLVGRRTHQHNFARKVQQHWGNNPGPGVGTTGYRHHHRRGNGGALPPMPRSGNRLRGGGRY